MKAIWIALVSIALLAGSAAGASKGTTVDLVAYSTPKDAYGKIISAFQGTAAGSASTSRTAPPATRRARSPLASPPTS